MIRIPYETWSSHASSTHFESVSRSILLKIPRAFLPTYFSMRKIFYRMDEVTSMASIDEKTAYQEGNRIAMNYLQVSLMAGSIFISASFAIFGLSFTFQSQTYSGIFLMGVASVLLYAIFFMYNEKYSRINKQIIFPILQEIEQRNLTVNFHTRIHSADNDSKSASRFMYNFRRIRTWNIVGFVGLIVLWVLRILFLYFNTI
jgi:hypothetical protein